MKPIYKIAQNTIFLSASQLVARVVSFLYIIFLARSLSVENFGIYVFILAFVNNFNPVIDFGTDRLILKETSRDPESVNQYFQRIFPLRILLASISYILILVLGLVINLNPVTMINLSLLGLILFPNTIISLVTTVQNAKEKMGYSALANIGSVVFTVIPGILFIFWHLSLSWIVVAYLLGNVIVACCLLFKAKSFGLVFHFVLDWGFCKSILIKAWPFASMAIISIFYFRLSIIMMELFKGEYLTGIYSSAFKFVEGFILIPQSLALALFPLSSRLFLEDKAKLISIYKKGLIFLFSISLPISMTIVFLSKYIINLTYGNLYLGAVSAFSVLGLAIVLFFVNSLAGNVIQNSTKIKQFVPILLFNFFAEALLCYLLIPKYSILGAAWAVVGGELIGLIINNLFIWRILRD